MVSLTQVYSVIDSARGSLRLGATRSQQYEADGEGGDSPPPPAHRVTLVPLVRDLSPVPSVILAR